MKKSELEQIIKEEIRAVLFESDPKRRLGQNWFQRNFTPDDSLALGMPPGIGNLAKAASALFKGTKATKAAKVLKPTRRLSLAQRNLFSRIKTDKIEIHTPTLDKLGRLGKPVATKPSADQLAKVEGVIRKTMDHHSKGRYEFFEDALRANLVPKLPVPKTVTGEFANATVTLQRVQGKELDIIARIVKAPPAPPSQF